MSLADNLADSDLRGADPGDPRVVRQILERTKRLTPEEWKERLEWVPEGLEHKRVCVPEAVPATASPPAEPAPH